MNRPTNIFLETDHLSGPIEEIHLFSEMVTLREPYLENIIIRSDYLKLNAPRNMTNFLDGCLRASHLKVLFLDLAPKFELDLETEPLSPPLFLSFVLSLGVRMLCKYISLLRFASSLLRYFSPLNLSLIFPSLLFLLHAAMEAKVECGSVQGTHDSNSSWRDGAAARDGATSRASRCGCTMA